MMRETVGGRRRMMPLLQATRDDTSAEVVAIATRLDLRYPSQYLNPKESKAPAIEKKKGRSGTVATGLFWCRDEGEGQEGQSKPHITRLIGQHFLNIGKHSGKWYAHNFTIHCVVKAR